MKPEHLQWLEAIWSRLSQVTDEVLAQPAGTVAGLMARVHALKGK